MKKFFPLLVLTAILFNSCNFSDKHSTDEPDWLSRAIEIKFVSELSEEYSTSYPRSAIPELSDSTLLYNVTATGSDSNQDYTFTRTGCSKEFTLPLIPGISYTIKVDAYDRTDSSSILYTGTKENITVSADIDETNGPFVIPLQLYKDSNGNIKSGYGSLSLKMMADFNFKSKPCFLNYELKGNGESFTAPGQSMTRGIPQTITIENIPANANPYDLWINIKLQSEIVYQIHSDVMIFAGTVTNTWKNETELGTGDNSNTLVITQPHVDAYVSKFFYIKNDSSVSDDGQGTYETPWRILQSAIDKITEINDGESKYTVYILNDLTGSYSAQTTTYYPGRFSAQIPADNTKNLKICIQGIDVQNLNSGDNSIPEIAIDNQSAANTYFEFVNLNCTHKIQASNTEIKLTKITVPQITLEGTKATFVGVTSDDVSLDGDSDISIGGYANCLNTIGLITLPQKTNGGQLKMNILKDDFDSTPLTMDGSRIGISTAIKPSASTPVVAFTKDFANSRTTESASAIFTSVETGGAYALGIINDESSSDFGEAAVGISSAILVAQGITPLNLKLYTNSVNTNGNIEITDLASFNISHASTTATEITVKALEQNTDVTSQINRWNFEVSLYGKTMNSIELNKTGISFNTATASEPKIIFNSGIKSGVYQVFINPFFSSSINTKPFGSGFSFDVEVL